MSTGSIIAIQYSPDGRYMATASVDNYCKLWDTSSFMQKMSDVVEKQEV